MNTAHASLLLTRPHPRTHYIVHEQPNPAAATEPAAPSIDPTKTEFYSACMALLKKDSMRHVNFLSDTGSHGLRLRKITNNENGMSGEEIFLSV